MTTENGRALGWDEPIEDDGQELELLPDGTECDFTVSEMAKATSAKLGCPMAKLKLLCTAADGRKTVVSENLVLHTRSEWRLCQFFSAIGQRRHGEKLVPKWNQVPGAHGRCRLSVETFTKRDGGEGRSNKVDRYLLPAANVEDRPDDLPF